MVPFVARRDGSVGQRTSIVVVREFESTWDKKSKARGSFENRRLLNHMLGAESNYYDKFSRL